MKLMTRAAQTALKRHVFAPSSMVKRNAGAYDAPGQTTTDIINHSKVTVNMIGSYSQLGFRLMNNTFLCGPSIILRTHVFGWDIGGDEEITPDSLELFYHMHPPIDLLIIGLSDPKSRSKIDRDVLVTCRKNGIQVEIMPSVRAVSTFNFLVESRNVGGAFVPPSQFDFNDDEVLKSRARHGTADGNPVNAHDD